MLHLYMKKILPKIRDNLHDIKETVRHAMVDLLTAVSNVKMIKYWDICPIEQILARLEVEKSDVICRKITDVLFNSYSQKQSGPSVYFKNDKAFFLSLYDVHIIV